MKKQTFFITLIILTFIFNQVIGQKTDINYTLEMPQPQTHYFEVTMDIEGIQSNPKITDKSFVDVKLPVWTPGSYLVREYARHVEGFSASNGGTTLNSKKINKNTWRVQTENKNKITVKYKVYAFELTVRTSFLDESHGYLNGASIFMYVPQLKASPSTVKIKPYEKWNEVSTGLPKISKNDFIYYAADYDILVDSPIEIGTHKVLSFNALNIPHKIAMFSVAPLQYDEEKVLTAYKKTVEAAASVVGEHPCKDYTFIIHHQPGIGGGLEHLNSTTCQTGLGAYTSDGAFKGFMSLIAHEYFHLWNVKRIRPIALGPFDYDNENYTTMLWVSEGFTSFYQDYILRRAEILTPEEYQGKFMSEINTIENQPGNKVQSVSESSWDAWIKYYRPNENSRNSTISYYDKGGVIGGMLNLLILNETDGKKNLDNVFKILWSEYYKKEGRGFKDEEFKVVCEQVAGKKLDDFFAKYINGTDAIDYNTFFGYVGLKMVDEYASSNNPFLGATGIGSKIASITKDSPAYVGGLNVGDEVVEVDGVKISSLASVLTDKKVGDLLKITVKRAGELKTYNITLTRNPAVKYKLEKIENPTKKQEDLYKKWMYLK